ncbi:MAG: hypothetical protein H8F28_07185, partial [Fibrella sp.]|nr:hypothetical protein [Armatimonadota bacterium]
MNRLAFFCLLLVLFISPARAQETAPVAKPAAKSDPTFAQHPASLWNPSRGLLLAVCPADKADRLLGIEERSAGTLSDWLAESRNRSGVFGELSAINDARRSLDMTRPEPSAGDFAWESAASDTSLFLASLTYPQWQKMASPNGLGRPDLKKGGQLSPATPVASRARQRGIESGAVVIAQRILGVTFLLPVRLDSKSNVPFAAGERKQGECKETKL